MARAEPTTDYRPRSGFRHPGRTIGGGFAAAVTVGAVLLSLPLATADGQAASLVDALFTATSAVCVTGLVDGRHRRALVAVRRGRDPGC